METERLSENAKNEIRGCHNFCSLSSDNRPRHIVQNVKILIAPIEFYQEIACCLISLVPRCLPLQIRGKNINMNMLLKSHQLQVRKVETRNRLWGLKDSPFSAGQRKEPFVEDSSRVVDGTGDKNQA